MNSYDDIINLPHHVSVTRPQMSLENRAAQFSPFQALTGYEAAIDETARLTDKQIELDENAIAVLDMKLAILADKLEDRPKVVITFFRPDERKAGGAYVSITGAVKKIDDIERVIVMLSGEQINIHDIINIEGDLFQMLG